MLSIKARVVPKGEKEFEVVIGEHVVGTAKQRFDADLHANVLNNALEQAYKEGRHDFAKHVGALGPIFGSES